MKAGFRFLTLFMLCILSSNVMAAPPTLNGGNKPIEIAADSLEVMQESHKAIFTGHVVAVQGDVRLKSDRMIVHYRERESGKGEDAQGSVSRIDAEGNVFMATPQETASGAKGVYEVDKKTINLYDKVVLTRGQNVLKGDALVYNMESGQSKLTGSSVPSMEGKPSGQRVRALFVPEKKGEAAGGAKQ